MTNAHKNLAMAHADEAMQRLADSPVKDPSRFTIRLMVVEAFYSGYLARLAEENESLQKSIAEKLKDPVSV